MQPDPEAENLLDEDSQVQLSSRNSQRNNNYKLDLNRKRRGRVFSIFLISSVIVYFVMSKYSSNDIDLESLVVSTKLSPSVEKSTTLNPFETLKNGFSELEFKEVSSNELADILNETGIEIPDLDNNVISKEVTTQSLETTTSSTTSREIKPTTITIIPLVELDTSRVTVTSTKTLIFTTENVITTTEKELMTITESSTSTTIAPSTHAETVPSTRAKIPLSTTTKIPPSTTAKIIAPSTTTESQVTTIVPKSTKAKLIENGKENAMSKSNKILSDNSPACLIPKLHPKEPSFLNLVNKRFPHAKCRENYDLLFQMGPNSTIENVHSESKNFTGKWKDCCYRVISRENKKDSENPDNEETMSKNCYPLENKKTKIPEDHEFIAVYCTLTNPKNETDADPKMVDVFAFVPLKPKVEERIKKLEAKGSTDGKLNLVVLGIDAVSAMNFQRIMPKVIKYLKNNLSALSMEGYSKIGDNTYPNILVALSSWNTTEAEKKCVESKLYDKCPFIWKNFSAHGYRTFYGEDSPWMGIFNYVKKGFIKPPTDYYLRPFSRTAEKYIENDHQGNAHLCYGPRLTFEILLNYIKATGITMGDARRYFQFIWATSLTHDYLNAGQLGENILLSFLQWFNEQDSLRNNTVFVLMSDHGIRWGPFRALHQGKIEENMPFLYFVFPKWFRKKYKLAIENMSNNRGRLTTPYDTYETFKDILFLQDIENKNVKVRSKRLKELVAKDKMPRGISMFLPVPKSRTCKSAEIAEHWCICHTSEKLSVKSTKVEQAANYAVFSLNSLVAKFPKCAYLALESVLNAELVHPQNGKDFGNGDEVYELAFVTTPGQGTFDATVVKDDKGKWKLSGGISRTNLYGNQSFCVDDKEMKKYCFCLPESKS